MIEQWNVANDFVSFARRGELQSKRGSRGQQAGAAFATELQGLHQHMLQLVLTQPKWTNKLTPRDLAALTPLIWDHMNPYGHFDLDMNDRLLLE